jgi:hypothetical protein
MKILFSVEKMIEMNELQFSQPSSTAENRIEANRSGSVRGRHWNKRMKSPEMSRFFNKTAQSHIVTKIIGQRE